MAIHNHLLFSEIFFQQIRRETSGLDNLRATLGTIRDTWQYYLPPPDGWGGPAWVPSNPFPPDDVTQLRTSIVEPIFAYLELTYGPCKVDDRAFLLYSDWTREERAGLCLVLPYSADIEGRDSQTGIIPKGRNYAQQLIRLLRQHDLDWGVLTNGRHWRLFHRAELSPTETYLHVDLERIIIITDDIHNYIVFHRFFSRPAFARQDGRQRLDLYKQQSDKATEVIEDHLSAHVEEIARQLCQGLVESCRAVRRRSPQAAGEDVTAPETRTAIYKNALFLIYRLLFVLYAEARDLLPLNVPAYRAVCLRDLLAKVRENHKRGMDYDDDYAIWDRLQALFALIDQGDPETDVPAYNGGLFDPGRRPFLTEHTIRNDYLQAALIRLATMPAKRRTYDQDREPQPIDYRDLSVRHLGSLYEGLLEYNLFVVEDEPRVVRVSKKKNQYVPYSQAGKVRASETVLPVGAVYFSETEGERKATGSYYTPEDVVDYIVRHTVGEKLAELKAEFYAEQAIERQLADLASTPADIPAHRQIQAALDDQFLRFVRQKVLDLKILDPAMGSGHFLVNATHAVADFVVELLNETPWENAAIDTDVATWKRQVAERCIFGVDLNELAVELAKLCLWMTTAAKGKPLTFLDHHLRWGNSLVGARLEDVGVYPLAKKESKGAFTLPLERFQVDLDEVLAAYETLYAKSSDDVDDVREKARIFDEEIYPALEPYRGLFSLHTGVYFGNGLNETIYADLRSVMQSRAAWEFFKKTRGRFLLEQTQDWHLFHWELEYPEVFLSETRKSQNKTGFDVVIGNPPYLRMERIKSLTSYLKQQYRLATPRADIYIYFYERALDLLREKGTLSFISSSTFARTRAGVLLRDYLRDHTTLNTFVDFGDLQVFEGVTTYPAILVLTKKEPPADHAVHGILAEKLWTSDLAKVLRSTGIPVPQQELESSVWRFEDPRISALRRKITESGVPLGEYHGGRICWGIKAGLNEAFVLDQRTRDLLVEQDPRSAEILKPLLEGKDLKPWRAEWRGTWLIYTYHGIDIASYPAVLGYLRTFKHRLEQRATAGRHAWHELQQPQQAYVPAFESPKIVWPNLQNSPRYSFDTRRYYINAPACCLPTDDWVILAVLNSTVGWYWMQSTAIMRQSRWLEAKPQYVANVPIPHVSDADREAITELAQRLSEENCLNRLDLEGELNDRVAALYGLTPDEQQIVDGLPLPNVGK